MTRSLRKASGCLCSMLFKLTGPIVNYATRSWTKDMNGDSRSAMKGRGISGSSWISTPAREEACPTWLGGFRRVTLSLLDILRMQKSL